jgi:hypothetical protein
MQDITELQQTLQTLPIEQKWELAHWLLDDLHTAPANGASIASSKSPDYAARRRQIFGDRVIPNMVLAARGDERW